MVGNIVVLSDFLATATTPCAYRCGLEPTNKDSFENEFHAQWLVGENNK